MLMDIEQEFIYIREITFFINEGDSWSMYTSLDTEQNTNNLTFF